MLWLINIVFACYIILICYGFFKLDVAVLSRHLQDSSFSKKYNDKIKSVDLIGWSPQSILDKIALVYLGILGVIIYVISITYFTKFVIDSLHIKLLSVGLLVAPFVYYQVCLLCRKNVMKNEIDEILELMITSAKSGSSFEDAIIFLCKYIKNKYILIELTNLRKDFKFQASENVAWELFKKRVNRPNTTTIVNLLQQSSSLGVASYDELISLIHNYKKVRAYELEERSNYVSIKSNIVLLLFGGPCIIIITVGPKILNFIYQFQEFRGVL